MPATATGRGAQVILDGDAQRAARGAYAPTYSANARVMESLRDAGLVADGTTTPDGTTKTGSQASDYVIGPAKRVGVASMSRSAGLAQLSNPRTNPIMATPPAITQSATINATLTRTVNWNDATASVYNFYGGKPTADIATFCTFNCVTINGGQNAFVWRAEAMVDAIKVQFTVFNYGGTHCRFLVNDQYVAATQTTVANSATSYITLDFTAAGGRAVRKIALEGENALVFQCFSVLPTESLTKPGGTVTRMFVVSDSFGAGGGATERFKAFPQVLGDLLGMRDLWNNGVSGTGYLNPGAGQLTFRQRLSDMVTAAPDIVLIVGGHNDTGPAALQAEILTYLTAIRAQSVLSGIPVIVAGVNGANQATATTIPLENAMAAAVTAFADPLMYFVPEVTNAAGPWFTGTGSTAGAAGNGNCDVYISSDAIHPNDAGHAFLAGRLADDIRRILGQW
jgi:lysophospholipase L1-like esterase